MNLKSLSFSLKGSFPKSKYSDVKLSTLDGAGRVINAHKVVLAAVSVKLEKLIDKAGEGVVPVTVRNIRFEVLEKIIEFIYSGEVEIEDSDVEDFEDGLDMLRIRVKEQVDQNETLRSSNIPVSEVGNVPVREDGKVKVPNNLSASNNQRTVPDSSVAVPDKNKEVVPKSSAAVSNNNTEAVLDNNKEAVQEISNLQGGSVDILHQDESFHQISVDSSDALPRSRLSSFSSCASNSETAPYNSTPLINNPKAFSLSSPAVSNISVAVRKLQKYRRQAGSVSGDSDRESVSPKVKLLNPCYAISKVSDAESETKPEEDDPPSPDLKINNITSGNLIIKYNVSNPKRTLIKCPMCEDQFGYGELSRHCKKKHPKVAGSSKKVSCNVCHHINIPSYSHELHLQVYHLNNAEKVRLDRDDLGMAGSSRISDEDNLRRFHQDIKNSEKKERNSSDNVTGMSENLKRKLENVGDEQLKTQKMETQGQLLSGYGVFFEDVSDDEGVGSGSRKVRCLLCGDGKLLTKRNIRRHLATHETLVKCPSCGKEFNGEQIKRHTKLCSSKNAQVLKEITDLKERARLKFVMGKFSVTVEQKARSPILKSLEKFSQRAGVLKKYVEFKIDNRILEGSELASEFDGKTIEVSKC